MNTRPSKREEGFKGRAGAAFLSASCGGFQARPLRLRVSVVILSASLAASAQYSLDWSTIDGGGGASTNGQYSITGTIGQPDAGPTMTNGQYSVAGGFWASSAAVQTPGAPWLSITLNPERSTLNLSWAPNTPGFILQECASLTASAWTNSPSGTNNPTVVPATLPAKFYRLHKP